MTAPVGHQCTFPSGCTGTRRRTPDGVLHLHLSSGPVPRSPYEWVKIPLVASPAIVVTWAAYLDPSPLWVLAAVLVDTVLIVLAAMAIAGGVITERLGTEVRVIADTLHLVDRGEPYAWPVDAIRSIEPAPAVGDNAPCLVVRTADEEVEEVVRYREMPELRWLADEIRAALPLRNPDPIPDRRPPSDVIDYATPPFVGERLAVRHDPDGSLEIHLRPDPLWKRRAGLVMGLVLVAGLFVGPIFAGPWTWKNAVAACFLIPLAVLVSHRFVVRYRHSSSGITVRAARDGITMSDGAPPRRWRWSEITSIDAGHDTSGDGARTCLFVRGQDRVEITLAGHPLRELQWIARTLQQARGRFSPPPAATTPQQQGGAGLTEPTRDIPLASVTLHYADVVTARGVTLDRDGGGLLIRLPVSAGCRWLWTTTAFIAGTILLIIAVALAIEFIEGGLTNVLRAGPCSLIAAAALGAVTAHALAATRIAFAGHQIRLTPTTLTVKTVDCIGPRRLSRPRAAVIDIRLHSDDESLLVYADGYGLFYGLLRGQDPRVIEWIAHTLSTEVDLTRRQQGDRA